jgi:hypothetical protein
MKLQILSLQSLNALVVLGYRTAMMRSFQSADHEYPCGNTMRRDDMRLEPAALRSSCGNPETNEADASTMPRRKKNGKEMEVYDSFAVTTYGCRTATPTESLTIVLNASPAPGDPISFFLFSSLYIHFSVFVPLYTFFCFRPSIYIFGIFYSKIGVCNPD